MTPSPAWRRASPGRSLVRAGREIRRTGALPNMPHGPSLIAFWPRAGSGGCMNRPEVDALVIGAGPAGAAVAIGLAKSGWRIALIETAAYPRQKVCGECLNPASLQLLDALGVGQMIGA